MLFRSPHLYQNSHNLRGGNFLFHAIKHLGRHLLPRVLPKIEKAYQYYKDNADDIHETVQHAQKVANSTIRHVKNLRDLVVQ